MSWTSFEKPKSTWCRASCWHVQGPPGPRSTVGHQHHHFRIVFTEMSPARRVKTEFARRWHAWTTYSRPVKSWSKRSSVADSCRASISSAATSCDASHSEGYGRFSTDSRHRQGLPGGRGRLENRSWSRMCRPIRTTSWQSQVWSPRSAFRSSWMEKRSAHSMSSPSIPWDRIRRRSQSYWRAFCPIAYRSSGRTWEIPDGNEQRRPPWPFRGLFVAITSFVKPYIGYVMRPKWILSVSSWRNPTVLG